MTDRKLTRDQIAKRALDLCETLGAIDAENDDFSKLRAEHKAAIERLETRSSRLRREIESGLAEEEQMHLDDADKGAPEKDPATASYEAGRLARETGKPLDSCPYAAESIGIGAELRTAWIGGWEDADTAAQLAALDDDGSPPESADDDVPWNDPPDAEPAPAEEDPTEEPEAPASQPQTPTELKAYELGFTDFLEGKDDRARFEGGSPERKWYIAGQIQAKEAESDNTDDDE